jgi:hypothetical protein
MAVAGRLAIVTDVGSGMRWTRQAVRDEFGHAYGEIALSRSPTLGSSLQVGAVGLRLDTTRTLQATVAPVAAHH